MAYKINNIVENYDKLSGGRNIYYEQEIFTKFEDAFVYEIGSGRTGLKIVHNKRSIVAFPGPKDEGCELADLRCLFYSPIKRKCRLLFLQFKKNTYDSAKPFIVKIPDKQYELYNTHPTVYSKSRKIYIPGNILKDYLHGCDDSGTMFALVKEDKTIGYPIAFANAKKLRNIGACKYECMGGTAIEVGCVSGFSYCEYAPDLKSFLEQIKEMNVGREIPLKEICVALGEQFDDAPADLKELTLVGTRDEINKSDSNYRPASSYVNTMFLNVDQLV